MNKLTKTATTITKNDGVDQINAEQNEVNGFPIVDTLERDIDVRIRQIVNAVDGLKYYEWSMVKIAIEKKYNSMSAKLVLSDIESLRKILELEFK